MNVGYCSATFKQAVHPMPIDSIAHRLLEQARIRPEADAYFVRDSGQWRSTPWRDYVEQSRTAGKALIAMGLSPGDAVCILGFNTPEWCIFDMGAMMAGAAAAGIYTTCSAAEVQYIIDHAEAEFVLVETKAQWEKINSERERLPKLKHVVLMKHSDPVDDDMVLSWDAFVAKADGATDEQLQERLDGLREDQTATFIYTSGTTGPPKAVMLSHKNLTFTASVAQSLTDLTDSDCSLSYLPLSHIAEQMFSIHAPITVGSSIYFAESMERLKENLIEVQPTVFFGVPRVWEKFHAGIASKLKDATGVKAKIATWAQSVGTETTDRRNRGEPISGMLSLKHKIADRLVFSKLKPKVGLGRARICVSGAAPISPEVLKFFAAFDLTVLEVYGQSEDCGPTTFNIPGRTRYGTVGPAVPGVDVKIAEDGEILVRGPNVFAGYYKDAEATAEALDADGWLHSGDLGAFDADGFLSITGRKKDIIITAGGKNIAPKNIEAALKDHVLVEHAVVIGDRRRFLSALITLDPEAAAKFATENGLGSSNWHEDEKFRAEIQSGVDGVNAMFARVEHVRKFAILPRGFTVEDAELTPTLKIKRRIINDNWSDTIEAFYAEKAQAVSK